MNDNRRAFERLESVDLQVSHIDADGQRLLEKVVLPNSVRSLCWELEAPIHEHVIFHNGHWLCRAAERIALKGVNTVTKYARMIVEFDALADVSNNLTDLELFVRPEIDVASILESCKRLKRLERLTLIHSFGHDQLRSFLADKTIRRLKEVELFLTLQQWRHDPSLKHLSKDEQLFSSEIPPASLLKIALDAKRFVRFGLHSNLVRITRDKRRILNLTLKCPEAACALATVNPRLPIASLAIVTKLAAADVAALVNSDVFAKVNMLTIESNNCVPEQAVDDEGAQLLAECPQLRNVRALRLLAARRSPSEAIELCSNRLTFRDFGN